MDNAMKPQSFSPATIEKLKYYVYALVDIVTNKIRYIGKGQNNRVFDSLKDKNSSLRAYIVKYGLTENEALKVESTLIDLLPFFSFSDLDLNIIKGLHKNDAGDNGEKEKEMGIASVEDIENQYAAPIINPEDFQHNVLIVSIDRSIGLYDTLIAPVRLYECARKSWKINLEKAKQMDFVIAKYNGILREIYKPISWEEYPSESGGKRYGFTGEEVTDSKIRELYLNKKFNQRSYGQPFVYILNKKAAVD